jgi:ribosomal protein S18 acetylase RimI-like enzyme
MSIEFTFPQQNVPIEQYCSIALETHAFKPEEIPVLRELLHYYHENPENDYYVIEARENGRILGFILFGPTPLTEFAFDLYWIVVDKNVHRRGVGRKLVDEMVKHLLSRYPKIVIRVETAGKDTYSATRLFYEGLQYTEAGRIPDFYEEGDDLVLFCKTYARS